MIIGIDIDNVIVNTAECVIEYLNERLPNLNIDISQCHKYMIENNIPDGYGLIVQESFENRKMWKKIKMIDSALEYISKLFSAGHEIYFVTSSHPENLRKKIKHMQRNMKFLNPDYIFKHTINIHNKQLLRLDILIDDCLDNLIGCRTYKSICLSYPWNSGENSFETLMSESIILCRDWKEIYDAIVRLNTNDT